MRRTKQPEIGSAGHAVMAILLNSHFTTLTPNGPQPSDRRTGYAGGPRTLEAIEAELCAAFTGRRLANMMAGHTDIVTINDDTLAFASVLPDCREWLTGLNILAGWFVAEECVVGAARDVAAALHEEHILTYRDVHIIASRWFTPPNFHEDPVSCELALRKLNPRMRTPRTLQYVDEVYPSDQPLLIKNGRADRMGHGESGRGRQPTGGTGCGV